MFFSQATIGKNIKKNTKTNILLFSADIHTYKLTFVSFFMFFFAPSPNSLSIHMCKFSTPKIMRSPHPFQKQNIYSWNNVQSATRHGTPTCPTSPVLPRVWQPGAVFSSSSLKTLRHRNAQKQNSPLVAGFCEKRNFYKSILVQLN